MVTIERLSDFLESTDTLEGDRVLGDLDLDRLLASMVHSISPMP